MRWKILLNATVAVAFSWVPAKAGPGPEISGKYALNFNTICENGLIQTELALADFDHKSAMSQITGIIIISGTIGGSGGLQKYQGPNTKQPFSNTPTTVTITDTTYNAVYGPITNGIAHSFIFTGISVVNNECAISGTAIRQ